MQHSCQMKRFPVTWLVLRWGTFSLSTADGRVIFIRGFSVFFFFLSLRPLWVKAEFVKQKFLSVKSLSRSRSKFFWPNFLLCHPPFFPHAPLVDCGYVIVSGGDSIHLASLISFFYFSRRGHLCFTVDLICCCCFICPHNSRFISFRFILIHLTNNRCLQRKVGPVRQSGHSWQGCSGAGRRRSHSHLSTKVNKNFNSHLAPHVHKGRNPTNKFGADVGLLLSNWKGTRESIGGKKNQFRRYL
jgi:hypothetical protein